MPDVLFHSIAILALLAGNALLIGLGFIIARWSSAPTRKPSGKNPLICIRI